MNKTLPTSSIIINDVMNCTLNATEEGKNFSRSLLGIIQPVALTVLLASSLVLNSLVIGVLRTMNQHGSRATISNRFMLNMALSNIMLSMTATPLAVTLVLQTNATFNQSTLLFISYSLCYKKYTFNLSIHLFKTLFACVLCRLQ